MYIVVITVLIIAFIICINSFQVKSGSIMIPRLLKQYKMFAFISTGSSATTSSLRSAATMSRSYKGARGFRSLVLNSLLATKALGNINSPFQLVSSRWLDQPVTQSVVIKRPLDNREYKALTLDNGLRVLLILDSNSSRSAAALDVHVGSFSDPVDMPGLAHFCEHMTFLGTKKYPEEDEFSNFLATNGGSSNAYTDSEDTVYYFDVNAEHLSGALDRFGQFFAAPLFTEAATHRELNAVDSEHAKNINNDGFRLHQLDRDAANPAHPMNRFATGNKDTLLGSHTPIPYTNSSSSRSSNQATAHLRERLVDFHSTYYVAPSMTLTVQGARGHCLADLEAWVRGAFSGVPSRTSNTGAISDMHKVDAAPTAGAVSSIDTVARDTGNSDPAHAWWGKVSPFLPQSSASVLEVVPVAETRSLTLSWPVWVRSPAERRGLKRHKPDFVLTHLLGHEGPGSLRSALISRGYVNSLQAYVGTEVSDCQILDVHMELTDRGFTHRAEVAEIVFAYINLLRQEYEKSGALPDYLFDELRRMSRISFEYAEKSDPASYVSALASTMQTFTNESEYLTGNILFEHGDQDSVRQYLKHLTPENTRMVAISPSFQDTATEVGRFYGTKYRSVQLANGTAEERAIWERLKSVQASMFPELALPAVNDLLPEQFHLVAASPAPARLVSIQSNTTDTAAVTETTSLTNNLQQTASELQLLSNSAPLSAADGPPVLLRHDPAWQLWHKLDRTFQQPKTYTIISLAVPQRLITAKYMVKSRLFSSCFLESQTEFLYTARLAGLAVNVDFSHRGVDLILSGFSDKIELFAKKICAALHSFQPDEVTFQRYKEQFLRDLGNFPTQQPYFHASYYASLALESHHVTVEELTAAASVVELSDIQDFIAKHFAQSYGKALVAGNVDAPGAERLVGIVQSAFPFSPLPISERAKVEVTVLPAALCEETAAVEAESVQQGTVAATGHRTTHEEPNAQDPNSATLFQFQLPSRDPVEYMHLLLLAEVLEQPFYHSLRTQQQLGYIVSASVSKREGVRYLTFLVQSSIANATELTHRVEAFLAEELPPLLERLTEAELGEFKRAMAVRRQEPDQRLTTQAGRYWSEILSQSVPHISIDQPAAMVCAAGGEDGAMIAAGVCENTADIGTVPAPRFQRREQEVIALEAITLPAFKSFALQLLSAQGTQRRLLVSEVASQIALAPSSSSTADADSQAEPKQSVVVLPSYIDLSGQEMFFQKNAKHM